MCGQDGAASSPEFGMGRCLMEKHWVCWLWGDRAAVAQRAWGFGLRILFHQRTPVDHADYARSTGCYARPT